MDYVVLCYEGPDGNPVAISAANPLPSDSDANVPEGANPTVTVALAAKNGTADTFMRSDAAPALDQSITPTWTGAHIFGAVSTAAAPSQRISSTNPQQELFVPGAAADAKRWNWIATATGLALRTLNDAGAVARNILEIVRNGNAVQSITFGNTTDNPPFLWAGNGPWTVGGSTGTSGATALLSRGNGASPSWGVVAAVAGGASANTQAADLNMANFFTAPVDGLYRVSGFLVQSQAATTSSTLPGCTVAYTEPITGAAVTSTITQSANTNTVGLHTSGTAVVQMRGGTGLTLTTTGYASDGATPAQYAINVIVERLQ